MCCDLSHLSKAALESRARRAAARVGYKAIKSRWRSRGVDNFGGFMLINPRTKWIVGGKRFDMSAEAVIERCRPESEP